ncbi:MAG: FAD-dependent oxidoreductase [Oscillospiraceae bacterium]|jgi:2,4-dienoyl-CoA reductase-like NADH-dependent reductase (Old Yellow Enzyme family)/thioredoxin reductase
MAYDIFLSEGRIGSLRLKNRSVFPPMGSGYADEEGFITQQLIDYHVRRVEGGCAMNIVEIAVVHYTSYNPHTPGIYDDKFLPGLSRLAGAIKEAGGVPCIQLWHGGPQQSGKPRGGEPFAPSAIPSPLIREMPHEMTADEIHEIIKSFSDAALRAKKAGFEAVELHGAHGYLIDSFLNEYSNKRSDEYGGSSENRARFGIEVIKDVRSKVGPDFPIIVRIVGSENVENGVTLEDAIRNAKWFVEAGADALDVSQGCYGAMPYTVPPYYFPYMINAGNCGAIREAVNVPVICAGRINTPEMAEEILRSGKADFISLGRVQLCDPDFVLKSMENRPGDIVHCISCNSGCVENMFAGGGASCVYNAATGHEGEFDYSPAEKPKNILVIGGGVGGLEAARVAADRGHKVTLFEKTGELGGQFLLAGIAPHKEIFRLSAINLGYRAMKSGVDIRLYTEATEERIRALDPDFIIVAAGSEPMRVKLEGEGRLPVYEARDFLRHRRVKEKIVAVLGGGLTGLEIAEILTEQGKTAIVIEMLDTVGRDLEMYIAPYMLGYLKEHNIEVYTNTRCIGLDSNGVIAEKSGKHIIIPCQALIIAAGNVPNDKVTEMVKKTGYPYEVIGDNSRPGKMKDSIWRGNEIGRTI